MSQQRSMTNSTILWRRYVCISLLYSAASYFDFLAMASSAKLSRLESWEIVHTDDPGVVLS